MVRRPEFMRVGMFDESIVTSSDGDWFFRAKDLGLRRGDLPQTLVRRRLHSFNQSREEEVLPELLRVARQSIHRMRLGRS
ncbi:hypothetical protein D3C84_1235600 [compost metagenome]